MISALRRYGAIAGRSLRELDWAMLLLALFIAVMGVAQIYSATTGTKFVTMWWKQGISVSVGLFAMLVMSRINYHSLCGQAPYLLAVADDAVRPRRGDRVGWARAADGDAAPPGPSAVLQGRAGPDGDDLERRHYVTGTNRTRCPGATRFGGSRRASHIDTAVVPSRFQPPGVAAG